MSGIASPNATPVDYTQLVVPVDGSSTSARSLVPAKAVADALGATVSIVSVVMPSFVSAITDKIRGQASDAGLLEPSITLDVSSMAPGERLLATLDVDPRHLLCLATTGRSHFGQVLGSVAEALLRARTGPFLLVGPDCDPEAFGRGGPIIVAVDGSEIADSVLEPAASWASTLDRPLEVVTVIDPEASRSHDLAEESNLPRSRAQRIGASNWDVLHGSVASDAIVTHATDHDASLIVMATHGRSGLARVVLGSVAMEVVHRSPCPVLLHRPAHLRTA